MKINKRIETFSAPVKRPGTQQRILALSVSSHAQIISQYFQLLGNAYGHCGAVASCLNSHCFAFRKNKGHARLYVGDKLIFSFIKDLPTYVYMYMSMARQQRQDQCDQNDFW
jgi:hypothetical protein